MSAVTSVAFMFSLIGHAAIAGQIGLRQPADCVPTDTGTQDFLSQLSDLEFASDAASSVFTPKVIAYAEKHRDEASRLAERLLIACKTATDSLALWPRRAALVVLDIVRPK